MATVIYPKAAQKLWEAVFDWASNSIKLALLDSTYVYDAADEFYSDLTGVVGTPVALSGKSNSLGVLDADNTIFPSLTGSTVRKMVVYKDTGVASTSPLALYIDAGGNLPFTPDGSNVTVQHNNGPNKICKTETG